MSKATVLVIEDDKNLQTVIKLFLEENGFNVLVANNGKACLEKINAVHIDVILLDLVLPDSDGLSLMSDIRLISKIPIIVVSGKSESIDKILGLELGADDYLGKPFEMRELLARIKSVLRRTQAEPAKESSNEKKEAVLLKFANFILDRTAFHLSHLSGEKINLTIAEFKILEILLNSAGRVVSRANISEIALNQDYKPHDRAIDIHVARIRKKIGDTSQTDPMIKTVRSVGYMFCQEVEAQSK